VTFGSPPRFENVYLSSSTNPTKATPPVIRSQLEKVGLNCADLTDPVLQGSIGRIVGRFPQLQKPNDTYLIGEQVGQPQFGAGSVLAGVRDLLPAVAATPVAAQLLVSILASTHPGTRAFLRQFFGDDTVAHDFQAQVVESRPEAEAFIGRVANAAEDEFPSLVEDLQSPSLRFLAGLATAGLQPTAIGTWIPKSGGVIYEPELTTMYQHWDRMKLNMGSSFVGVDNTWPSGWESGNTTTAFENLFVRVALQSSAALVAGLSKPDMEAMLANRVGESAGADQNNYDSGEKTMAVFLVGDYNPVTEESEGLGFLTAKYRIQVQDYRDKSKDSHDPKTLITGLCRACMFTSEQILLAHARAAAN
jgi:uncharacterized protein (DUF2267 family)